MSALFQPRPYYHPVNIFYSCALNYSIALRLALHKTHDVYDVQTENCIERHRHCQAKIQILKCPGIY